MLERAGQSKERGDVDLELGTAWSLMTQRAVSVDRGLETEVCLGGEAVGTDHGIGR